MAVGPGPPPGGRGALLPFGLVLLVLLVSLPSAGPSAAQTPTAGPAIEGVRLDARLDSGSADAGVEVTFRLRVPPGTEAIPLHGLAFGGTEFVDVEARLDGRPVPVVLDGASGAVRTGRVRPARARGGEPSGEGTGRDPTVRSLRLIYRVRGSAAEEGLGPGFDVRLPVLRVDWEPVGSEEGMLRARMSLPSAARITERLPTVPMDRRVARGRAVYRFSLPAVPSLLRYRGRLGGRPALTLGRWVDLGVLGILVVLGLLGWRAFRRA